MRASMAAALALSVALTGCATKRFTRLPPLSSTETTIYTCRELQIEKAKTVATMEQIRRESGINVASVMGFLGDFGIGNANERNTAERLVGERYRQIERAEIQKGCLTQAQVDPVTGAAVFGSAFPVKYPANTASGICMVVPQGYRGTQGAAGLKPAVTDGTPVCPNNQPPVSGSVPTR